MHPLLKDRYGRKLQNDTSTNINIRMWGTGIDNNDEEQDSGSGDESYATDQGSQEKGQTVEWKHQSRVDSERQLKYMEETQPRWFEYVRRMRTGRTTMLWLK